MSVLMGLMMKTNIIGSTSVAFTNFMVTFRWFVQVIFHNKTEIFRRTNVFKGISNETILESRLLE